MTDNGPTRTSTKNKTEDGKVRARDRLREFYKIPVARANSQLDTDSSKQQKLPGTASGSVAENRKPNTRTKRRDITKRNNPLDIDTAVFDSKKYLKHLLLDKDVGGLLAADNKLVTEIRQIDGDMKTMVYENYNKFISATETIGKMKRDAEYMDSEMEKLTKCMNEISTNTSIVDSKFAKQRNEIQQLSSEHRLLSRLQFLFDLPDQLNKYIGMGKFVDAARLWSRTQPLLEHYRQLGVFESVENNGKEIMASVENTIWNRWRSDDTGISEGAECALLLVLLRPGNVGKLWREYLEIQSAKNRKQRQKFFDEACMYPPVCGMESSVPEQMTTFDPDPSGAPLPSVATANSVGKVLSEPSTMTSRISYFNSIYLSEWNSLVVGFTSQFISPEPSIPTDQPPSSGTKKPSLRQKSQHKKSAHLLSTTAEDSTAGLLTPLIEKVTINAIQDTAAGLSKINPSDTKRSHPVFGWQAMNQKEIKEAHDKFACCLKEWCAEYSEMADSLICFPDNIDNTSAKPYLDQIDDLVSTIREYPILNRIGGLHECVVSIVHKWQERLIDTTLHHIVKDLLERLEYYFDPMVDLREGSQWPLSISTQPQLIAVANSASSIYNTLPRSASTSRHRRNSSLVSANSQGERSGKHQRTISTFTAGWSGINSEGGTYIQNQLHQNSNIHNINTTSIGLDPNNGNSNSLSLTSPNINASLTGFSTQKITRSSTVHIGSVSRTIPNSHSTISRNMSMARIQQQLHKRNESASYSDCVSTAGDDIFGNTIDDPLNNNNGKANNLVPTQLRRSFSLSRSNPRRYKPWVVNTVNRNSLLHVFLADTESWLIQQVLERVNPLLECVVQHYLDIEGSQILEEYHGNSDDGGAEVNDDRSSTGSLGSPKDRTGVYSHGNVLPSTIASRLRQEFIKTLNGCLDKWMLEWMPDTFLYSAQAIPMHGTKKHIEKLISLSPMSQLGISIVGDPVASLLLARFAVDLELTLTQSIYQLCEQGISILPEDPSRRGSHSGRERNLSTNVSISNLVSGSGTGEPNSADSGVERMYSMTASMTRADSMASTMSRRGVGVHKQSSNILKLHQTSLTAKWHGIAEKLVKHFIMTVGQDISTDYLQLHVYESVHRPISSDRHSPHHEYGHSKDLSGTVETDNQVSNVSEVWITICRWLRQIEEDTNALFYDPVFSSVQWSPNSDENDGSVAQDNKKLDPHQLQELSIDRTANGSGFSGSNALRLGVAGNVPTNHGSKQTYNPTIHAHILSNIDRLFAEHVDIFPSVVNPLTSGKILTHLAMQIIKAALEALRLRPQIVLKTRKEFCQVVADVEFLRSWMLRYSGVMPQVKGARRMTGKTNRMPNSAPSSPVINEGDVRAIQNLLDDWISSAKMRAFDPSPPDANTINRIIEVAWNDVYFGPTAHDMSDNATSLLRKSTASPVPPLQFTDAD